MKNIDLYHEPKMCREMKRFYSFLIGSILMGNVLGICVAMDGKDSYRGRLRHEYVRNVRGLRRYVKPAVN